MGGVARPVDTLLMASLLLYCSQPFGQVASSSTRQLAFVFRVRGCLHTCRDIRVQLSSACLQTLCIKDALPCFWCAPAAFLLHVR